MAQGAGLGLAKESAEVTAATKHLATWASARQAFLGSIVAPVATPSEAVGLCRWIVHNADTLADLDGAGLDVALGAELARRRAEVEAA